MVDARWASARREAIIKIFVMKSGCFGLVDRGAGLASRAVERASPISGELQKGSNIGKEPGEDGRLHARPRHRLWQQQAGRRRVGAVLGNLARLSAASARSRGAVEHRAKKEAKCHADRGHHRNTQPSRKR